MTLSVAHGNHEEMRIPVLDGLRACSILLVLAGHLIPLGPSWLGLNSAAATMGMALFFSLSGFLIIQFLATGMSVSTFVVRRLARIVPLAWAAVFTLYALHGGYLLPNLLFYSNIPPFWLMEGGGHLWSLSVEVQFYSVVAIICLFPTRKVLFVIPIVCVYVTIIRYIHNVPISIVTWYRVDEILAGGTIALFYVGWFGNWPKTFFKRIPLTGAVFVLFACCYFDPLFYLRPYAGALVIATGIYSLKPWEARVLINRPAGYIAEISYALYVVHGVLSSTWLGSGERLEKYLKRPLLFAATFAIAHISTFYMERPIVRFIRSRIE
jgi:peptidoglycan/LPS O-acetylase OafA/YrhL